MNVAEQKILVDRNGQKRGGMIVGPNGEITRWVFVTAQMSEEFLATNIPHNRRWMPNLSEKYGSDMTQNLWVTTHEGLAFDTQGQLVDGQHRLKAIITTGVGQWLLVTTGLVDKAIQVINRGKVRTLAHTLQILGYAHSDNRTIAVSRSMLDGPEAKKPSTKTTELQLRNFIDTHIEAITFAVSTCTGRYAPAVIAGLIARAYYHSDPERLARFCQAMIDEIPIEDSKPEDVTARRVKKAIDGQRGLGGMQRVVLYQKAQNGLAYFLAGKVIQKIYATSDDLFPLPEDKGNAEQTASTPAPQSAPEDR